jgi:hypothetical protein
MAQITVNIPTQHVQRLKDWLDDTQPAQVDPDTGETIVRTDAEYLQLARDAVKEFLRAEVQGSEERKAVLAARDGVPLLDVTD